MNYLKAKQNLPKWTHLGPELVLFSEVICIQRLPFVERVTLSSEYPLLDVSSYIYIYSYNSNQESITLKQRSVQLPTCARISK